MKKRGYGEVGGLGLKHGSWEGEKKRRLKMEQVKMACNSFELGNKLESKRRMQLARALGL
ncbi:Homeobox-leucine zipper protein ATHB-13, partial [Mucuna pruriens]